MKKWILSILALSYFVVTCGVVVNFHYCMDRLASTSFFGSDDRKCGRCGMDIHESDGCCRDEMQIIKLQDDQVTQQAAVYELTAPDYPHFAPSEFISASTFNVGERRHFHNHSPPLLSEQDRYLQLNVFRI